MSTLSVTKQVKTTCPYCGVGCGVLASPSADGQTAEIEGDQEHPANFGRLCSKGSALGETLTHSERLLHPERNGEQVSWDIAANEVAKRFRETIEKHGPESVAFYVSGQLLTEDYYVANKLMKGGIGASNIDTNSRLCMASSVAGHKRAFGSDTVPGCYEDLELADLVVLVGSNFAWCHPVLHQRLLEAKEKSGLKLVVIDPRETATTQAADLHLKIKSGGDIALFNGLLSYLSKSSAYDVDFVREHTIGFDEAIKSAQADLGSLVSDTGLELQEIENFYNWVAKTPKTLTVYSQGVNQSSSGTDKVNAIINTHLATGRIGKPGMGPFSITGQPNAMGGREVGGLANQLAAHMDFAPDDVDRVQRFWRSDSIASKPGLKAVDLFDAVDAGKIKALWIMATNPAVSMPNADFVRSAIEKCDFVVVSDIVSTSDTLQLADVKLPATGWGEKSGSVTNSERRISRQRSFLPKPGEARHDWEAICDVARRMGYAGFDFTHEAEIFKEFAQISCFENKGSRDFDIGYFSDITIEEYDEFKPVQWPVRNRADLDPSPKRFFANGDFFTAENRAKFLPVTHKAPQTKVCSDYPYVLNTGRIRDQWHTMTRTGKTSRLSSHIAEPFLEIHPKTASDLGIDHADIVEVKSQNGRSVLRALLTERVSRGDVFAPIHWSRRYASNGCIDEVVGSEFDPISGQPESKYTPVKVRKMNIDWWGFAALSSDLDTTQLENLAYWSLARRDNVWGIEMAGTSDGMSVEDLKQAFRIEQSEVSELEGLGPFQHRVVSGCDDKYTGVLLMQTSGPVAADRNWLCQAIGSEVDSIDPFHLLSGFPAAGSATGRTVCSCLGVSSSKIDEAIAEGAKTVADVGKCTLAGTNCGSCKPEIAKMLEQYFADADFSKEAAE